MKLLWNRRTLLGMIPGAALLNRILSPAAHALTSVEQLAASVPADGAPHFLERRYRVHAVVTFLGIPLASRKDVGLGFASAERLEVREVRYRGLQFAAGSTPERAGGIDRAGVFQEVVFAPKGGLPRAAYFGFMTSSPEMSMHEARESIDREGKNEQVFQVIEGFAEGRVAASTTQAAQRPPDCRWPDCGALIRHMRASIGRSGRPHEHGSIPHGTSTFLNSVFACLVSPEQRMTRHVVFNGKLYEMHMEKSPDHGMMRVEGSMVHSGSKSSFQLWYRPDAENILPERFEYRPRPFLRLTFISDARLTEPVFGRCLRSSTAAV